MPFIPHTKEDIQSMLDTIGVKNIMELFSEIPGSLRAKPLHRIPEGMSEMETSRLMQQRALQDGGGLCFIGAGAYEHHIPAAVWDITSRGEFMTAYTPYQAEASQGTLQLLYEYQTMMASLTGMDVSNASLYDGATALAEAVLMAVRANRQSTSRRVLIAGTVHSMYRKVVQTIVRNQKIEWVESSYSNVGGNIEIEFLEKYEGGRFRSIHYSSTKFFWRPGRCG
jgi:glycine dehydrogenase subunit 1